MSIKATVIEALQDYEDGFSNMSYGVNDGIWWGEITTYDDYITLDFYDNDYTLNMVYSAHIDKWAHWEINDNLDKVINSAFHYNTIGIESED